jgi:hypothetical protein
VITGNLELLEPRLDRDEQSAPMPRARGAGKQATGHRPRPVSAGANGARARLAEVARRTGGVFFLCSSVAVTFLPPKSGLSRALDGTMICPNGLAWWHRCLSARSFDEASDFSAPQPPGVLREGSGQPAERRGRKPLLETAWPAGDAGPYFFRMAFLERRAGD